MYIQRMNGSTIVDDIHQKNMVTKQSILYKIWEAYFTYEAYFAHFNDDDDDDGHWEFLQFCFDESNG